MLVITHKNYLKKLMKRPETNQDVCRPAPALHPHFDPIFPMRPLFAAMQFQVIR